MRFKNTHIDLNSTKPRNLFITITPAMTQQKKKLESLDRSNFAIKSIKKKMSVNKLLIKILNAINAMINLVSKFPCGFGILPNRLWGFSILNFKSHFKSQERCKKMHLWSNIFSLWHLVFLLHAISAELFQILY